MPGARFVFHKTVSAYTSVHLEGHSKNVPWILMIPRDGRLRVIFAQPLCLVEYFRFSGCIKSYFSSLLYFIKISAHALL